MPYLTSTLQESILVWLSQAWCPHCTDIFVDWEFVGSLAEGNNRPATDAAGYLSMLKALRTAMPLAELSAAVPMFHFLEAKTANSSSLSYVDMHPYVEYFDRVYLMAYDLWNGPDTAGSNGALDPDEGINPDNINQDQQFGSQGVQAWNEAGFPLSKLVYGAYAFDQ
jgi:GH18 family chitinase